MLTFAIVAGMLVRDDQVLMLRRAQGRRHSAGCWEPVCGYVREHEAVEATVLREVAEETGLETRVVAVGHAFEVESARVAWLVKPFVLEAAGTTDIVLSAEHDDAAWVYPEDVLGLDCVAGMERDLEAVGLVTQGSDR
jgi:8-oxo-dGTP diphosphatase